MGFVSSARPGRGGGEEAGPWGLGGVYPTAGAWGGGFAPAAGALRGVRGDAGRLGESGAVLLAFLQRRDDIRSTVERIWTYPALAFSADTGREDAAGREQRAIALSARLDEAVAFVEPELVALGER